MEIQSGAAVPWTRLGLEPQYTRGPEGSESGVACRECRDPEGGASTAWSGGASSLSYKRTERFSLLIQTQDGDLVRLSFRTRERVGLQEAHFDDGTTSASAVTFTAKSNSKISMTIEGNLSAEEMAAIQDTFDQAAALAEEFFAGNTSGAFEDASALNFDAEQLAQVMFHAGVKEKLTYSAVSFASQPAIAPVEGELPVEGVAPLEGAAIVAAGADVPEALPAAAAAVEPTEGPVTTQPANDPVGVEPAPVGAEDSESAEAPEQGEAGPSSTPLRVIGGFLSRIAEAFAGGIGGQEDGVLGFSLKVRIFESTLVTMSQVRTGEESPLPQLVPETLEAVAQRSEQGRLDQVA
ncbi:MAG: hypothetical protein R3E10_07625 [Gemmatimonadota bacterium]